MVVVVVVVVVVYSKSKVCTTRTLDIVVRTRVQGPYHAGASEPRHGNRYYIMYILRIIKYN